MVPLLLLLAALPARADKNLDTDPLPPKVLYHVGEKKFLQQDAAANTIPDDVWKKNIMGEGTGFGLVPYRRGLYGGANFDTLELYGNRNFASPMGVAKTPWVMKITIKDECLKPEAVSDLGTDKKYLAWLLRNVGYLTENARYCLNLKTHDCRDYIVGTQPIANGQEANLCDDALGKFMADVNPRVVRDTEWDASWYLRDRSCIEKLEADPGTVLQILAGATWSWQSRVSQYDFAAHGYGTFAYSLLVDALADSDGADPAVLAKLRAKVAASDIREDKNSSSEKWVAAAGVAALDAYSRCGPRLEGFRVVAAQLDADFASRRMNKDYYSPPVSMFREERIAAATAAFRALCNDNRLSLIQVPATK